MGTAAAPGRRPALSVLARALVAGTLLGGSVATALAFGGPPDAGVVVLLPAIAGEALVGTGTALISALGWLLVVGRVPRWVAELVAALVAAAPFVFLGIVFEATIAVIFGVVVGLVAAAIARWQGYDRRSTDAPRPRSSPRAG